MRIPRAAGALALLGLLAVGAGCAHLASRRLAAGPTIRAERILFRYWAPTARRVQLAGDWPENNWARGDGASGEADVGLMQDADGDGVWELEIELGPGRYRYLFWVDELSWHTDPGNPEEVKGGPAGVASQLIVEIENGGLRIR